MQKLRLHKNWLPRRGLCAKLGKALKPVTQIQKPITKPTPGTKILESSHDDGNT